jgi:voltage-gated potassium channel
MEKRISQLNNHVIICGYGRNGKKAADELLEYNQTIVVIENDQKIIQQIKDIDKLSYIEGDSTAEEILKIAKIESAKAIITTLPNDADNLFVVLSSRDLNENITIISRASEEHSDYKLRQAGANNIIMPDKLGGQQMAKLVTHPDIVEFLDFIMLQKGRDVKLFEVFCDDMANCNINKTIGEFNFRHITGANIVGIKASEGDYIFNPSRDIRINCDDKIFVLGTQKQIDQLKEILYSKNE